MAMESNTTQRLDTLQVGFFSFRRCLHHGEQSAASIGPEEYSELLQDRLSSQCSTKAVHSGDRLIGNPGCYNTFCACVALLKVVLNVVPKCKP